MEKYTYLLLSLSLLTVWFVVFLLLKNESRKILVKISTAGGLAGIMAEFWYFKDYWHPLSLFGSTIISFEDFLFGFAFTGVAANIYKVIFRKENKQYIKGHRIIFFIFFVIGIFSMLLFSSLLKINSIFVSSFTVVMFSFTAIFIRKDLAVQSAMSGILSLLIIIPIYVLFFDLISPKYWDKSWLLAGTDFGIKIIGNIPITEILWYFSWGCFAGVAYDFYHGSQDKVLS